MKKNYLLISSISDEIIINQEKATKKNELAQNARKDEKRKIPYTVKNSFQTQFKNPKNIQNILNEFENRESFLKVKRDIHEVTNTETPALHHLDYSVPELRKFVIARASADRLNFMLKDFSLTMNNDILFDGLDNYSASKRDYRIPPLGLLGKIQAKDFYNNYNVEIGVRTPLRFNGLENYILFDDLKKRWDKTYALYYAWNKENSPEDNLDVIKQSKLIAFAQWKYPISYYSSIALQTLARWDHEFTKHSTRQNVNSKSFHELRVGIKPVYVYDDVFIYGKNLKEGTQVKVSFEISKPFIPEFEPKVKIRSTKRLLGILTTDARYFYPIDGKTLIATRAYYSASIANERVAYLLGGTENWVFAQYANASSNVKSPSFQDLASSVRGYRIGERIGTSVLLTNIELRIPPLWYFFPNSTRPFFMKDLLLVSFFDLGVLWEGILPNRSIREENLSLKNSSTSINARFNKNPFIASVGLGLRLPLFNYYIRLDQGWQIQKGKLNKGEYHIALGLDF